MRLPPGALSGGAAAPRPPGSRDRGKQMVQRHRAGERLGAHVSVQGGVDKAPVRGKAIGATAIQVFTKTPSQWREPDVSSESCAAFQRECERCELSSIVGHDSYLI